MDYGERIVVTLKLDQLWFPKHGHTFSLLVASKLCWLGRVESNLSLIFVDTTRKINIESENDGLKDVFPLQMGDVLVPC